MSQDFQIIVIVVLVVTKKIKKYKVDGLHIIFNIQRFNWI